MCRVIYATAFFIAAACGGAAVAMPGDGPPVYPGATKVAMPRNMPVPTTCGHKISIVSYHVAADGRAVAAWYAGHVSNRRRIDTSGNETNDQLSTEFISPDGAEAIVVLQMRYDPRLAAAAKSIGADKTSIAFERFDPPLGQEFVDLMIRAKDGDGAAKHEARLKIASLCPNP